MRVLDIDLDFFLADCCPLAAPGDRPTAVGHEPWSAQSTRAFLEENCGLSRDNRLCGRRFDTHDGALFFWQELMLSGRLSAPFEVVHIDAHSDLGIGRPGPGFVLKSVLSRPLARRCDIRAYKGAEQLDEANYLLFALALRWVSCLTNVRNPRSRPDMPREIAQYDCEGLCTSLLLRSDVSALFEGTNGREPVIPYREYADWRAYRETAPFDFISLARSPRYSPPEADALMDVIGEYMI